MANFKYILIIAIITMMSAFEMLAQKLSFQRSDVDSNRCKFITATYIFGIDIYADDVEHCSNVTFELQFNQTRFVRFSEWKAGNFGPTTKAYVMPLIDEVNDRGRIVVSCGLDGSPDTTSPSNPKVIQLKFAVIPAAPHFETVTFTVNNPRATVFLDGEPQIIALQAEPISYTIHSFVNVWPGDADNNGVVNHLDFATVSYFIGTGPNTKNMRSFKREPASTLWGAQSVIAWDIDEATYADCDGNGEVNMADNLVVTYNYDKQHPTSSIPIIESAMFVPPSQARRTNNSISIPINADTWQPYLAASGRFSFNGDFEFIGIEPTGLLKNNDYSFAFYVEKENNIEFITGTVDKSAPIKTNGVIANIIIEPKHHGVVANILQIEDFKAISDFGQIFDIRAFTSIEDSKTFDNGIDYRLLYFDNSLIINLPNDIELSTIDVFSIAGENLYSQTIRNVSPIQHIYLPALLNGVYYARLLTSNGTKVISFIVAK